MYIYIIIIINNRTSSSGPCIKPLIMDFFETFTALKGTLNGTLSPLKPKKQSQGRRVISIKASGFMNICF